MAEEPIVGEQVKASARPQGPAGEGVAADRAGAFRRLAEEHLDASYGLASAILGDASEAQDAVHDAYVIAWRKWDTLRDRAKFEPWFRSILVNTCRNRLRTWRRHPQVALPDEPAIPVGDETGIVHDHAVLDRAFGGLSADDQLVIILRYFLDLAADDMAKLLGVRPGTVGSRLNRATARLRQALDDSQATGAVR